MTLYVPDISHHQQGISIQALKAQGAAALIARVGQGAGRRDNGQRYATTRDREWARHRDEAKRLGLPLVPYWYVGNLLTARENAAIAKAWVGDPSLPWMIDHEDASGSIPFYRNVVTEFRNAGMTVALGYLPHWYWESHGRGNLAGPGMPPLVNSAYPGGAGTPAQIYGKSGDTSPRWAPYGGQSVALWQFTNKASLAGRRIDCSAFRGTTAQLAALLGGVEDDMTPEESRMLRELHAMYRKGNPAPGVKQSAGEMTLVIIEMLKRGRRQEPVINALAAGQDIDPAELAERVVAAQREVLEDLVRETVPDEQADRIIQALAERLANPATPAGPTGE